MPTIDQFKEQETPPTPLFLFECTFPSGEVERWSTHLATVDGAEFAARLLRHNMFSLQSSADDGLDGAQKISLTLANADSHYSQLERECGFKGAQIKVWFVFYDLVLDAAVSESRVVFRGVANPPDEITQAEFRISFVSRLNLQRVVLPEVRIERRCPWTFPSNAQQRADAVAGGARGKYSGLYRCGYSPDQVGGVGSLNGSVAFTSCDYTRAACEARGMFDRDAAEQITRRFGGVEFVPSQILVRSYGEKSSHLSPILDNVARYNDFVPLVYGTAWYKPPVVFARNDGNLTHLEVLLGMGEIERVVKVVVNGVEIPEGQANADMTATGWFNVVSFGARSGGFNSDFTDGSGHPLGDPYGSMAAMSVVVPNSISTGVSLAKVDVLLSGIKLEQFNEEGTSIGETFTNNPAWVLLDALRRSGWLLSEIDLPSFAASAAYCGALISTTDLYGNTVAIPRFQCNAAVQSRTSAAELVKGIRNASSLHLTYGSAGLLRLMVENSMELQQPSKPASSNSTETLNGGWPVYEFSDGSAAFSGLLRKKDGEPAIRLWSRIGADSPNRLTVEFQDEFNEYQQDSLALIDADDALLTSREVTTAFPALGLPNFDQAARMLRLQLNRTLAGYTFIEFETTVRGVGLTPGDLITVTYQKEGLLRQPFRIVKLAPGINHETVTITAQWHDDSWYTTGGAGSAGGRRGSGGPVGIPRPLVGALVDENGTEQFGITEQPIETAEGVVAVDLTVAFTPPSPLVVSAAAIPLIGLNATIESAGGTLAGGQTLYYAISGVDANGAETELSFVVPAKIASATNTNSVTLSGISVSPGTVGLRVYRGTRPGKLLRIATDITPGTSFVDTGATVELLPAPDRNYDHANFYWRWELLPETGADVASAYTIGNTTLGMEPNAFQAAVARIIRGKGAGQERAVTGNDGTTITVNPPWTVIPDATSYFALAEATWNFGGVGSGSPVHLQVPDRVGASVQISGRSANALDQESEASLNPLTSWAVGGGSGDAGLPPMPSFGLVAAGPGTVELRAISFPSLTNTHSISGGTLTLHYWNELLGTPVTHLSSAIDATANVVSLDTAITLGAGALIQIDEEILVIDSVAGGGTELTVTRGSHSSTAASHAASAVIYPLQRNVTVVAFVKNFFGSPASEHFVHTVYLPDVRIAAVEFFVTNARGNSDVTKAQLTGLTDGGLRTGSGGQITIQMEGYLAVETDAAPPYSIEATHVPRDLVAMVQGAPNGDDITLRLRQGATEYCLLTIADGETQSDSVSGFGLPPLAKDERLSLDIVSVPSASGSLPGRNLTVAVRF
ncbi:MAG: phage tail protein [Bryobacteraceae bacterium]